MEYTTTIVTNTSYVTTIILNRPARRNAMTPEMQSELLAALEHAATSPDCRVLILRGAGEAFCSGLDLAVLKTLADKTADDHRADAERVARLFRTLYELPIPTIAAVHGPAIAGGTGLATICDFTLAVSSATFGYTEARIGFVPALVSAFLSLQLGDKRSRDLLLTGRIFDAAEAHRLGLVNEIVSPEDLSARVDALAQTLLDNSPASLTATKRLLAAQNKHWLDTAIAHAIASNEASRRTADFHEGVSAFLGKRKPIWNR